MASRTCAFALLAVLFAGAWAGTNDIGKAFLEENKLREGVITLKSGLQYKVLTKGEGKYHPKKDSPCKCHYEGTTPSSTPDAIEKDGKDWNEFDSSIKRGEPTTFAPNQVIKGWTEAMQLMVEGDKWEMYIPSELGYGDGGSGEKIKGGDVLIFRMEILAIEGGKVRAAKCNFQTKQDCEDDEVKLIDTWGKKSQSEVEAEIASIKAQTQGTLKAGLRETLVAPLKVLKQIKKLKQKGVEL